MRLWWGGGEGCGKGEEDVVKEAVEVGRLLNGEAVEGLGGVAEE